ncbi:MAG: ABC transporter substrate-binding protein [Alphaproteobacteria bacterium]|nr:ABC transporter substrate-binding protein [Alphaproteobacteria bacterium]
MRVKFFLRLIIFSLLFSGVAWATTKQISKIEAEAWANDKGLVLLETLSEPSLEIKYEKIDTLVKNYVDLDYLAKFVMGKHWREMSEAQKVEYVALFKRYSLALYKTFPLSFSKNEVTFSVTKAQVEKTYTNVYVNVELLRGLTGNSAQKQNFLVEFRLHRKDNKIMIVDLKVAETSFILAYRSRFAEMIARNDGDIAWFLEDLSDMTKSIEITNEKTLNENVAQ